MLTEIEPPCENTVTIREFPDYFKLGNNCARLVYSLLQKGDKHKEFVKEVGGIMNCEELMDCGEIIRDKVAAAIKTYKNQY